MPKDAVPVFPKCCVVCLATPDRSAKIVQHSQNPLAVFFAPFLFLFGWSRVEFPICSDCKPWFYAQRWGRTIICWIIIAVACIWVMPYFKTWDPMTRKIAVLAICFVVALPYITYEIFCPRSFNTTAYWATTTYEFRSQDLGLQFYALNKQEHPYRKITVTLGD